MAEDNIILEVKNLTKYFPITSGLVLQKKVAEVRAVDGVSFAIRRGETLGLVGESGCGKSITARSILRIIPSPGRIDEGQILFRTKLGSSDGKEHVIDLAQIKEDSETLRQIRGGQISMIFQEPMTSFSAYHTLGDQISEAAIVHQAVDKHDAHQLSIEMLERVGIPNAETRVKQYPHEFSGGMRQRAMIAMAMICNPSLLIADEPTTSLDVTIQAQILELMRDLRKDFNSSVLFITHNLGVIAQIADEVCIMYMGKIVESGLVNDIFHNPKHPYTIDLLQAIPKITGERKERLTAIEGSVPSPFEIPDGCRFHPRCQHMIKGVCEKELPAITHIDKHHQVSCHLYSQKQ